MQAEHPPYDLPAHYADKAAQAFEEMRVGGWVLRLVEGYQKRLQCKCQLLSHPAQPVLGHRLAQRLSQLPTYLLSPCCCRCSLVRCAAQRALGYRPAQTVQAAGVEPNVVLWHNLLDCQVSGWAGKGLDLCLAEPASSWCRLDCQVSGWVVPFRCTTTILGQGLGVRCRTAALAERQHNGAKLCVAEPASSVALPAALPGSGWAGGQG